MHGLVRAVGGGRRKEGDLKVGRVSALVGWSNQCWIQRGPAAAWVQVGVKGFVFRHLLFVFLGGDEQREERFTLAKLLPWPSTRREKRLRCVGGMRGCHVRTPWGTPTTWRRGKSTNTKLGDLVQGFIIGQAVCLVVCCWLQWSMPRKVANQILRFPIGWLDGNESNRVQSGRDRDWTGEESHGSKLGRIRIGRWGGHQPTRSFYPT